MLGDWLKNNNAEFAGYQGQSSDLAAICYTSGTTGHPKGAMQSQRAVFGAAVGTALMAALQRWRQAQPRCLAYL